MTPLQKHYWKKILVTLLTTAGIVMFCELMFRACAEPQMIAPILSYTNRYYSVSAQSSLGASSLTYAATVPGSLVNSKFVITVGYFAPPSTSVSTVTWNGSTCFKILRTNNGTNQASSDMWYIDSPASGTHNIVITMSAGVPGNTVITSGSVVLYSVVSGTAEATAGSVVTGTHTTHSNSITTVATNAYVVDVLALNPNVSNNHPGCVQGAAQVILQSIDGSSQNGGNTVSSSCVSFKGPISPAGATTLSWTFNAESGATSHSVASFAPM